MTHALLRRVRLTLALGIAIPSLAQAEDLYSIQITNDAFAPASGDGHYTNGVELNRISQPDGNHWTRDLADWLPGSRAADVDAVGYHLSHQIYTPEDIKRSGLIDNDRPYAAVVIGGVSLYTDNQLATRRETSVLTFQLGWLGPAAGGRPLQKGAHKLGGNNEPRGWRHQLRNEPILSLAGKKTWWRQDHLVGLEWEYGPNASFQIGNLYDYLGAGGALRFGRQLDHSYNIPSAAPTLGGQEGFQIAGNFGWYGFVGVEGRFMARNLLLDGNSFESSHSVDRRQWVGDLSAGVALNWNRWGLAFTNVWRTHEFEAQDRSDQIGTVILSTWL